MFTRALITEKFAVSKHTGSSNENLFPADIKLRPAGVLVPLIDRPSGITVLLTQRTKHLPHHAGQISFPGGSVNASDDGPVAAALRETEEEIGLSRDLIQVVGFLPNWITLTGFYVTPIVGVVGPDLNLTLDPYEVAEAFEVPLDFVLDPRQHQPRIVRANNTDWTTYTLTYQGREIWGATGSILVNLYEHLMRDTVVSTG